jgi:hypothetical protein
MLFGQALRGNRSARARFLFYKTVRMHSVAVESRMTRNLPGKNAASNWRRWTAPTGTRFEEVRG